MKVKKVLKFDFHLLTPHLLATSEYMILMIIATEYIECMKDI